MKNTNMENPINNSLIKFLLVARGLEIPGVEIRDHKAFESFIKSELERIDEPGFIKFLLVAEGLEIPGVEIRDHKAFESFIKSV